MRRWERGFGAAIWDRWSSKLISFFCFGLAIDYWLLIIFGMLHNIGVSRHYNNSHG